MTVTMTKNKMQILSFKVNFPCQKSSESFFFFSFKNTNLGAHILLFNFFDKITWQNSVHVVVECPPKLSRPTGQIRYALNANLFNAQSYLAS